ncbi:MAG: transcription initiation factor IIB family protein [Candidatus Nitrosocosmicus sp.]|uniref:transcription initiation factor IIB n=1 Tax=Candidatus Nitrosocosmicus agrestis TaxID=2563600 RepID=UPI00122E5CB7|nr:transcription initiation factor IIB [Candidatus Nitrosocosmicus sp. SS]KAA2282746.1 transcription initiation factor IIB [Candidatus Nitrosocosmicus sp. SS]KAF0870321.1 transcription initiation factor IIB [Candidatus Nitrosocosmicus sp. SS]MDR4491006.1 transcription initiation factor IIB [Candidatus Nitrosocosmicus sp.]HET6589516.1 transcription initiation factor IIB [Candidatus Nitrosocosmicus sp.]
MHPEGKVDRSKPLICEFCKSDSVIFDNVSFEYVCSACGCVSSQDPNSDSMTNFRANSGYNDRTRTGMPESLAIHNKGLSTLIGIGDTDARGKALEPSQKNSIQRLRTWNNRAQLNDSVSRNLEKALKLLNNFGDKLYLSQAVIEGAAYIYRKAAIKKLAKGRSTLGLVGAALYAACRETATPKTITDIATACNITTKDIMSHYKLILKELSLQMPVLHGPDYVTLICNRLQLSEKTKREALRIFSMVQQNRISIGKNPRALAGSIIYLASQNCNEFLRQVEICQVAEISTVSLRKRCKEIKSKVEL